MAAGKNHNMNGIDLYTSATSGDLKGTRRLLGGNDPHTLFNLYFQRYQFGTQMPVLTFFSCLPPHDRVTVLQEIVRYDDKNEVAYEKLSMALLKTGQKQKANQLVEQAFVQNLLDRPVYEYLLNKLALLDATYSGDYGISTSYADARQALAKYIDASNKTVFRDFLSIFGVFCQLNGDDAEGEATEVN